MKVLMLYENTLNDLLKTDSRVQREAESLAKAGHEVTIFLVIYHKDVAKQTVKFGTQEITVLGNNKYPEKKSEIGGISRRLARALFSSPILMKNRKLLKIMGIDHRGLMSLKALLNVQTDVYHAHDFSMLWFARFCSWFNKKPFVYDSHELHAGAGKSNSNTLTMFLESLHVPKASAVITVTDSIAKTMAKRYKIPKPVVVSNYPKYTEYKPTRKLREKLGIADDVPIVLYLGAMRKGRGVYPIVAAAKHLPDVKFILMGHGPLIELIEKNATKNVTVLDAVPPDEVVEWASSANIGIQPILNVSLNHYYSFGNKVGEYIMAGIPIAVSDFPEMRKAAIEDDLGVVFDPDNLKDIVRSIKGLLEPDSYKSKKQNVMAARKRYCWESEEKKLLTIFMSIGREGYEQ